MERREGKKESPLNGITIEQMREMVREFSYEEVLWPGEESPVIVDVFSASAIVKAYDASSDESKERAEELLKSKAGFMHLYNHVFMHLHNHVFKERK